MDSNYMHAVPLSLDEAEKYLRAGIKYLSISEEDIDYYNPQSCDCSEIIICTNKNLLLLKVDFVSPIDEDDEGARFQFFTIDSYQQEYFNLRISAPDDSDIQFDKFHDIATGIPVAIRFNYQSRFLYVWAFEIGLTVTKSNSELFSMMFDNEKNNEPMLFEEDDSILFDCGLINQGCPWLLHILRQDK